MISVLYHSIGTENESPVQERLARSTENALQKAFQDSIVDNILNEDFLYVTRDSRMIGNVFI